MVRGIKMEIFTNYKVEWIIGISCTLLPGLFGFIIKKTANIPNITVPFWLFCVLVASIPTFFAVKHYSDKIKNIANTSFGVERVILDGKHFANCIFNGSELVFKGEKPFSFSKNELSRVRIKFESNAALTTEALSAMYADNGFRPIIEATLDNIKKSGLERSTKKN
jgi:hypothetical protein